MSSLACARHCSTVLGAFEAAARRWRGRLRRSLSAPARAAFGKLGRDEGMALFRSNPRDGVNGAWRPRHRKDLPLLSTPKHGTSSLRIAATTICLPLSRPGRAAERPARRPPGCAGSPPMAGMNRAWRKIALPIFEIACRGIERGAGLKAARVQPGIGDNLGAAADDIGPGQFGQDHACSWRNSSTGKYNFP